MIFAPSLHANSEYSFQESTIRIDSLIALAKQKGLTSLVITDHNNMHGAYELYAKCKKNNIKPIIGLDLDVDDYRLVLLAKNYEGFKELCRLSSMKMKKGSIKLDDIQELDLFVIDHPVHGYYSKHNQMLDIENYFIPAQGNVTNGVFIKEAKILTVDENEAISILEADGQTNITWKTYEPYVYELDENAPGVNQALEIIKECNVEIPANRNYLPNFTVGDGSSSSDFFKKLVQTSFESIYPKPEKVYLDRLAYEVSVIEKLGYEDYFLIIWDFIKWAKSQNISIGPGRGSAAGSLVSYVLGITEIDPIKYDLLFERFLNVARVSKPDIDIDIQDNRRDEVVKYLFDKYGQQKVAQITTFSRLGAKSAVRDVARVMDIPVRDVNTLTKLIPNDLSLEESYKKYPRFRAMVSASEEYANLYKWAKAIEGLPRQIGTHAAGLIIAKINLDLEFPMLYNSEGLNQIQYSMDYLEENGLLKIDLLGLKNLTILQDIQEEVWRAYQKRVDLKKISFDDEVTNRLLSEGDTNGVFQLESYGMKDTLNKVRVNGLEDVVAIISLYRPGPMESIAVYASRKNNHELYDKVNPAYDKITQKTYGIIIYQEQIMQLAQEFAGMSFEQADILRRAIGKKNFSQIDSMRQTFNAGALKKGYSQEQIDHLFGLIEKFADYGFNRSHAVAYGMLAYRIAYMKARFKLEFYVALMQSSLGSQDSIRKYVQEAKTKQIEVVAPSVNLSEKRVYKDKKSIVLPLVIIKGFGQVAEDKLIEERSKGSFKDFFDAVSRLKVAGVGPANIKTLIEANTMREFGNMQTLLDSYPAAERYADLITTEKNGVKVLEPFIPKPKLLAQPRNFPDEISKEVALFGFPLNAFPTSGLETDTKLATIKVGETKEMVFYVFAVKPLKDKNNLDYAIASVSDSTATVELTVFADEWKFVSITKIPCVVRAQVTLKEFNSRLTYNLVKPWKEMP